jgi:antitoxin component YwqK of YwqJK toxin-antitoxin module
MKPHLLLLALTLSVASFAQTTDASGKKQGYWKKKDDAGNHLLYEGEFKDNKPVGRFKYYYPNDSVRAIMNFKQNGKVAYAQLFHPTGKKMAEGKYVQEIKDSIWIYFDESGILISKDNYVMGKRNGMSYVYFPDGKVAEERPYKMDQQNGIVKQYLDGKNLRSQTTYVNGELDGKASYFYPNGIEVAAGYYKNSLKTGPWIYKEENGKIKEKELYIDGQLASKKETEDFFAKNKTAANSAGTASTNTMVSGSTKENKTKNKDNKGLYNLKNETKGK